MVTLLGNYLLGPVKHNGRLSIIFSRFVKSGGFSCRVEGKGYSTSPLVKYIPKKSRKGNENISKRYEVVKTEESCVSSPASHLGHWCNVMELNELSQRYEAVTAVESGVSSPANQLGHRSNGMKLNEPSQRCEAVTAVESGVPSPANHLGHRSNGMKLDVRSQIREAANAVESGVSSSANHLGHRSNGVELNLRSACFPTERNPNGNSFDVEPQTHDTHRSSSASIDWLSAGMEEELDVDLLAGDDEFIELADEMVGEIKSLDGVVRQDVEKLAIQLLASRACTAHELKKKLQGKWLPPKIIDAVISDFQTRGMLNDCSYAETYSRSKWSSSSWGPVRIKQGLLKKGITAADADKAIKLVFNDGKDGDPGTGISRLSIDQLYAQVSKQWQRSLGVPLETRRSRIIHWLQYRGFNWAVIGCLLKKLDGVS